MALSRRHFVLALLAAPASRIDPWFRIAAAWASSPAGRALWAAHRLAGCLREAEAARVIGRAYLATAPAEAGVEALVTELTLPRQNQGEGPAGTAGLKEWLAQRSRDDFAAGRVVSVDGWLLSESEARLYALVALLPRSETHASHGGCL